MLAVYVFISIASVCYAKIVKDPQTGGRGHKSLDSITTFKSEFSTVLQTM